MLSRSNGLPSDAVYNIFEDSKGFMWLATDEGLCRYDGFSVTLYRSDIQTSTSGSCIQEDKYGRIWYENFDGYIYYTSEGTVKALQQNTPAFYLPFGIAGRYIFVMQQQGINIYDIASLRLVKTVGFNFSSLESAAKVADGYCVIADNLLYKIDTNLVLTSVTCPYGSGNAKLINSCADGVFIVSRKNENQKLYALNDSFTSITSCKIPTPKLIQSCTYTGGRYWINTPDGTYAYAHDTSDREELFFKGTSISDVIKDRQGNYWFATTNKGIFIVPNLSNKIYRLSGYDISSITAAGGSLFAGTIQGGLLRLSQRCSEVTVENKPEYDAAIYYLYSDSDHVVYSSVGFTLASRANVKKQTHYDLALKSITRIDKKYYAIAGNGGCALLLNPACPAGTVSEWDKVFADSTRYLSASVSYLLKARRTKSVVWNPATQQIFCASNTGLFGIGIDGTHEFTISGNSIYATTVAAYNGDVYALSSKGSIYHIGKNHQVRVMDSIWGLPGGGVRLLRLFGDDMYIAGGSNLYRYRLVDGLLTTIDAAIDPYEINDLLWHDNKLWIATNEGIAEINSIDNHSGKVDARFYINAVLINNKVRNTDSVFKLHHNECNITVQYAILDFGTAIPARLSYRLNGGIWKETSSASRTLNFPALSPGIYIIDFKLGGSSAIQTITFDINQPFWGKWWFYTLCLCILLTIVLGYFKWKTQKRIKKMELIQERMQLEQDLGKSMLTSIRAQMNPHFFYNALNTIQAYIFTNDKRQASGYLAKFSRLTRIILEMSETETVTLSNEIDALTLYLDLEKMRFSNDFTYQITLKDIENKESIELPSMIIQPYVENAVKHGLLHKDGEKTLSVSFCRIGSRLQIVVDDNGIGRKKAGALNRIKAERFRSFSTSANDKRLELLNKGKTEIIKVTVEDKVTGTENSSGTRVIISIPL